MKSSSPIKLSILIVSFNTADLTVACINSVYKHAPNFSFEVIVIDNASTDNSIDALKRLRNTHKNLFLIENSKNVGFAKANNQGMKQSRGEYVFLLNSDTVIFNTALTDLVEFAEHTANVGAVAPQLLNPDRTVQASIFRLPSIPRAIAQYYLGRKGILDKYYLKGEPARVEAVVAAALLLTPKALDAVGKLDEKYFMYFEDIDYCRKLQSAGLGVYYLPEQKIIHVHGGSGKGKVNDLLIESSKKYFGNMQYYIYTFVLWSGQKLQKIF